MVEKPMAAFSKIRQIFKISNQQFATLKIPEILTSVDTKITTFSIFLQDLLTFLQNFYEIFYSFLKKICFKSRPSRCSIWKQDSRRPRSGEDT
jgi:hypothetical protein